MKKLIALLDAARSEAAKLLSISSVDAELHWLWGNFDIPRMQHDMNRFNHLLCFTQEQQNAYHRYEFLKAQRLAAENEVPVEESWEQELTKLRRKYDITGMEVSMLAHGHLNLWREDCQEAYRRVKELEAEIAKPVTDTLSVDLTHLEAITLRELLRRVVPAGFCANPRDAVHMVTAIEKILGELDEMVDEE